VVPDATGALLDPSQRPEFQRIVAGAIRPIDDLRGTAAHRRHAVGVLAGRVHDWLHHG
jgi:hypothetical protein